MSQLITYHFWPDHTEKPEIAGQKKSNMLLDQFKARAETIGSEVHRFETKTER